MNIHTVLENQLCGIPRQILDAISAKNAYVPARAQKGVLKTPHERNPILYEPREGQDYVTCKLCRHAPLDEPLYWRAWCEKNRCYVDINIETDCSDWGEV